MGKGSIHLVALAPLLMVHHKVHINTSLDLASRLLVARQHRQNYTRRNSSCSRNNPEPSRRAGKFPRATSKARYQTTDGALAMVQLTRDPKIGNNNAPQGVSYNATMSRDGLLYVALAIGYLEMVGFVYHCATARLELPHMYACMWFYCIFHLALRRYG